MRSELGPGQVFNPQRIGGLRSTFRWNPVQGCQDPATAISRADAFAFATVRMVMSRALAFMADPELAACVLPAPGTGFDIEEFLVDSGTVYLIAEAVSEDAPVAAVVHGEAQLAERWGDHGRQIVLHTSSVNVFLPGITDTTTLQAASTSNHRSSFRTRPDGANQSCPVISRPGWSPATATAPASPGTDHDT